MTVPSPWAYSSRCRCLNPPSRLFQWTSSRASRCLIRTTAFWLWWTYLLSMHILLLSIIPSLLLGLPSPSFTISTGCMDFRGRSYPTGTVSLLATSGLSSASWPMSSSVAAQPIILSRMARPRDSTSAWKHTYAVMFMPVPTTGVLG